MALRPKPGLAGDPPLLNGPQRQHNITLPPRRRPQKRPQKREFMFVDVQADFSEGSTLNQQKKIFLSKNTYHKKQQDSIQKLHNSVSLPKQASHNEERNSDATNLEKVLLIAARMYQSPMTGRIGHGYAVDPFCTHAMSVTASVDMYLYHYRLHITSATYPVDATRIHTWWWQKAIASETLLQIFVFLAAGHMAMLQSTSGVSSDVIQKSTRDCLHFRIKAIQCLNGLLRDPVRGVADSTVLIVSALLIIEALNADFESLETHTQGLKTLISLIGGLEALEHMTLNTVYTSVNITAALRNSAPSLPILPRFRNQILLEPTVFNGRDIEYKCEVPTALAQLATRFHSAVWSREMHPSINYRIDVLRRLVIHHELGKLSSANTVSATDNDLFVLWQHQMHCIHYASDTPNLNEPIRLTLLVYLFMRVSRLGNYPIMQYMVERLKMSLDGISYFQTTAPDLLFWILLIGGMASQGQPSHPWFVLQLGVVARSLGLKDWVDVRALLGQFFYADQPGDMAGEDVWNEALTGSFRYIAPNPTA